MLISKAEIITNQKQMSKREGKNSQKEIDQNVEIIIEQRPLIEMIKEALTPCFIKHDEVNHKRMYLYFSLRSTYISHFASYRTNKLDNENPIIMPPVNKSSSDFLNSSHKYSKS